MRIHFLYWAECPSHPEAWQRLQRVLADMGVQAEIERVEITTDEEAERWKFPGSPTILVEGHDIDPAGVGMPSRLTCRLYHLENGRPSPVPSETMIRRAVEAALGSS